MKGVDVTPAQIKAAERFLEQLHVGDIERMRSRDVQMPFEQFVRLLAWYGAIRALGVEMGISTSSEPGEVQLRAGGNA